MPEQTDIPINPNVLDQITKRAAMLEHYRHIVGSLELELRAFLKQHHPDLDMLKDIAVDLESRVIHNGGQE